MNFPRRERSDDRRRADWIRKYFSLERVLFVKRLPCSVPGCPMGPSENAHGEGGGTGRKAGWQVILPLCFTHHKELDEGVGREAFEEKYGISLARCAERTEELFQQAGDFPDMEF